METHTKTATVTVNRIPFKQVEQLSQKDIAYATKHPKLRPFYKYDTTLAAFDKVMADKSKDSTNRSVLVEVLQAQYEQLDISEATKANIAALAEATTFTITTAHQPSLATGPLYYIYKIVSAIHLCRSLNKTYPGHRFVPNQPTG